MKTIRVVLFGVGAMGSLMARFLFQKTGVEIVGAIDTGQGKVGRTLDEVLGLEQRLGVAVSDDVDATLSETKPNIVVHATSSRLEDVFPQLVNIVKHGANVVSTCEELSYPYFSAPQLAEKLDTLAKKHQVTILGTGINPGFLMDTLVITLTSVCQKIDLIQATRVMDAATRRLPFQKKIGAGLSEREFREAIEKKLITGHVGLEQSISMIASALAWKLDRIKVSPVEAVIAEKTVSSEAIKVEVGESAGLKQVAKGYRGNKEVIILNFQAYIGAEEEFDSITIVGVPCVNQKISPCVHGDVGTVSMIANSIAKVINAAPGLVTMKDLPIPSAATEDIVKYIGEF